MWRRKEDHPPPSLRKGGFLWPRLTGWRRLTGTEHHASFLQETFVEYVQGAAGFWREPETTSGVACIQGAERLLPIDLTRVEITVEDRAGLRDKESGAFHDHPAARRKDDTGGLPGGSSPRGVLKRQ